MVRTARRIALFTCSIWLMAAGVAFAQDAPGHDEPPAAEAVTPSTVALPILLGEASPESQEAFRTGPSPLMQSLYITTMVVQAFDAHSTFKALDAGALEGNPVIGSLAEHRGAFIALKASIATVAIYLAHDMSKTRKVAAALTLLALNSAYAALIAHNYRVAAAMSTR